ncbi:hypothetical protein TBLA_0E00870 [Henningerozyma blattae CBS 6284]|uniref:Shugoshin C-terminal domain-containing protein n=1 Tax=Henningerozyma blattae (strain ATCC 34711 / CBS 6284 / DSM 70876 / NBRC 10599 / NRRL Y-10934 / UCD 77-7) TaxID=1071380 RepID=I2H446_HENB6|nr:hypothetical protein TBLA_0E00870 [Tetrapisispora blattae CBS 6284]CCH61148.1 hypothetical protein TBLA_0E00870 [Tetrapisispora blattae CBS 6284]
MREKKQMSRIYRKNNSASNKNKSLSSGTSEHSISTSYSKQPSIQIQDIQDVIDLQEQKFRRYKDEYSQQNNELAKSNSALKLKINSMEKTINELIQENVLLRSNTSLKEMASKKYFNDQLTLLETGVIQRFEEIQHIINSFKKQCTDSQLKMVHNNKRPRSQSTSSSRGSIHFNESVQIRPIEPRTLQNDLLLGDRDNSNISTPIASEEEDATQIRKRKRRKSSRRDSIFIPQPPSNENTESEPNGIEDELISTPISNTETNLKTSIPIVESMPPTDDHDIIDNQASEQVYSAESLNFDNNINNDNFTFSNSLIETSIPEEIDHLNSIATSTELSPITNIPNSSKNSTGFKPKLPVFNDKDPIEEPNNNKEFQLETLSSPPTSLIPNKIKHSMKQNTLRRGKNSKRMVDEVMPTSDASIETDISTFNTRSRRTRSKPVNYKLPSLRSKMRRPSIQFVDATSSVDIHELEVSKRRETKNESKGVSSIRKEKRKSIRKKKVDEPIKMIESNEETTKREEPSGSQSGTVIPSESDNSQKSHIPNLVQSMVYVENITCNSSSSAYNSSSIIDDTMTAREQIPSLKVHIKTSILDSQNNLDLKMAETETPKKNVLTPKLALLKNTAVLKDITNIKSSRPSSSSSNIGNGKRKLNKRPIDGDIMGDGSDDVFNKNKDYLQCLDMLGTPISKPKTYRTQKKKSTEK